MTAANIWSETLSKSDETETLYYIEDYSDEVMPCAPSLQAWADWLSKPDEGWGRDEAAKDGEEFRAFVLTVLGDVRCEMRDGKWVALEAVPAGATTFYARHHQGSQGWDAELSGDTIEESLDGVGEGDAPVWLACVRAGPSVRIRYRMTDGGPRCCVVAPVQ